MPTVKPTPAQAKLLRCIERCPKGYYLSPKEDISAQVLYRLGLIRLVGITAYPVEKVKA
jgi:hypothetical protein